MNQFKAIERREITNTLPVGILEDGLFTRDSAGLAVRLAGFYTVGELTNILQDLKHVDAVYQSTNKAINTYSFMRQQQGINPIDACTDAAQLHGITTKALAAALITAGIDAARLSLI